MIDENVDPRMAMGQVIQELRSTGGDVDAFWAKINSAKNNVEAYQICLDTFGEIHTRR